MAGVMGVAGRLVRDEIDAMVLDGEPLEEIERALIDPAPLSEDLRAALWLYAWSTIERQRPAVVPLA